MSARAWEPGLEQFPFFLKARGELLPLYPELTIQLSIDKPSLGLGWRVDQGLEQDFPRGWILADYLTF